MLFFKIYLWKNQKNSLIFALANRKMVPWMSGLVSGLQNRVRRFESARNLKKSSERSELFSYTKFSTTTCI